MTTSIDEWAAERGIRTRPRGAGRRPETPRRTAPPVPVLGDDLEVEPGGEVTDFAQRAAEWFRDRVGEATLVGAGDPAPDLLIVGEAPADEELRLGAPFVGRSGDFLAGRLARLTDRRWRPAKGIYATNAAYWYHPAGSAPSGAEMDAAAPVLAGILETSQVRYVLACGRSAVRALLERQDSVARLRGRWHAPGAELSRHLTDPQGVRIRITWHPAYICRDQSQTPAFDDDLAAVIEALDAAQAAGGNSSGSRSGPASGNGG